MKNCFDIKILEKRALDQVRGDEISHEVSGHLESCQFCREQFEHLVQQFKTADETFDSLPEELIQNLNESIIPKTQNTFTLIARNYAQVTSSQRGKSSILTRAADSSKRPQKRYQNRGVLSTESGELIIRLIESSDEQIMNLHLIAVDAEKFQNVPVRIEPLGLDFITDDLGRIRLDKVDLPDIEQLKIVVQTQRTVFDLKEMPRDWREFIGKGEVRIQNAKDEHLFIEFNPEGQKYRLTIRLEKAQMSDGSQQIQIVANKEARSSRFESVKKGVAVFHDIEQPSSLSVKVFG